MAHMSEKDYQEQISLLDGRITKLTTPIPSVQLLRFVEGFKTSRRAGAYTADDYSNLLLVHVILNDILPPLLTRMRAESIDPVNGWRFDAVQAANGDHGLCGICENPFQHYDRTVNVHCIDMHEGRFHGVCRDCVREHGPAEFVDRADVQEWLDRECKASHQSEKDYATEERRIEFIDAIRTHGAGTSYFSEIATKASEWAKSAFCEWR